jgi:hypothetical protein
MLRAHSFLVTPLVAVASSCSCVAQQTTLPFQLQDNLLRISIRMNGQPVEAVLDSGAGGLVLDRAFAASVGVPMGDSIGMVPGGGAPELMFPVTIDGLDFGPEHMENVSAIALSLEHLSSSAGFQVHVLLGRPAFVERAILVNYPARKIVFFPVGVEPPCADSIPLSFVGGTPVVTVTLQATAASRPVTLHLIVDFGTRHFAAMLGGPFLDSADGQRLDKAGHPMQVGTGTGGVVMGTSVSVADLKVGSNHFANLGVALTRQVGAFNKGGADGSLGVPLWDHGIITLDYAHQKLCLDVPRTAGETLPEP